jgi:hypothetical protein
MKWRVVLLVASLGLLAIGMAACQPPSKPDKTETETETETDTHTVRVGDLQVTVTAAGAVSSNLARQHGRHARSGYHFVVVNVKFKNVGSYRNCYWLSLWLRVDLGFNYESTAYRGAFNGLEIEDLQPSDESEGSYVFQAKDGTHPVALEVVRNTVTDDACRELQHRGPDKSTPEKVTLSLRNLPEPAN